MRWFRMYAEVIHDPKVQKLPAELFRFWVNCLSLAAENGGLLPSIPDIAWTLRKGDRHIAGQVAALYDAGLLDREGDTFSPHNWAVRQYKSDTSTARVKRFRQKDETFQKRGGNVSETASETDQSRTETEADTEQKKQQQQRAPETGALELVPPKTKRPTKAGRTIEQVRQDLGVRRPWFEALCSVHPAGKEGVKAGMEAFERRVTADEEGHQLAKEMYRGAVAYAAKCAADPTIKVKWLQGWINDERWTDEIKARDSPKPYAGMVDRALLAAKQRAEEMRQR